MKKYLGIMLVLVVMFVSLFAFVKPPEVEAADGVISSDQDGIASLAAPEGFWTPERMASAIPMDVLEVKGGTMGRSSRPPAGAPQWGEGQLPTITDPVPGEQLIPEDMLPAAGPIEDLGYTTNKGPFTRFEHTDFNGSNYASVYPYTTIGKLFFTQYGGSYVCSASVIGSGHIFTAGHCVHKGDNKSTGWSTNVIFVPLYRNGSAPLYSWNIGTLATRTKWYQKGMRGLDQDMGAGVAYTADNSGRLLSNYTGYLGWYINAGYSQAWLSAGYPAASPYNGSRLFLVFSSYAYKYRPTGATVYTVGMGNDMTGGCSGGPWMLNFHGPSDYLQPNYNVYLNGVNSFRRTRYPREMFSPYFNSSAKGLMDYIWAYTP